MSKLSKLIQNPKLFMSDLKKKRVNRLQKRETILFIGFSTWKTYLKKYFHEQELIFLPKDISLNAFEKKYSSKQSDIWVYIWGMKIDRELHDFLKHNKIPLKYVEDGFVRSIQLGATKTPPMSLTLDSLRPYFDARGASDLENLLNSYDCNEEEITKASYWMKSMTSLGVSKYNFAENMDMGSIYGKKTKKRVLVIGQVEDDASIKFGCSNSYTNNDIVRLAHQENPNAQIIYKPHPDVLNGYRKRVSHPAEVAHLCLIIKENISLESTFETIDHVYTITSLSGFEALLRGIKVTTLGAPFYSGWGLTDERESVSRRKRNLTIEEVFYISYILYPKYFDTQTGESIKLESVINLIASEKNRYRDKIKNVSKTYNLLYLDEAFITTLYDSLNEKIETKQTVASIDKYQNISQSLNAFSTIDLSEYHQNTIDNIFWIEGYLELSSRKISEDEKEYFFILVNEHLKHHHSILIMDNKYLISEYQELLNYASFLKGTFSLKVKMLIHKIGLFDKDFIMKPLIIKKDY